MTVHIVSFSEKEKVRKSYKLVRQFTPRTVDDEKHSLKEWAMTRLCWGSSMNHSSPSVIHSVFFYSVQHFPEFIEHFCPTNFINICLTSFCYPAFYSVKHIGVLIKTQRTQFTRKPETFRVRYMPGRPSKSSG